jgi:hypothetical protein
MFSFINLEGDTSIKCSPITFLGSFRLSVLVIVFIVDVLIEGHSFGSVKSHDILLQLKL